MQNTNATTTRPPSSSPILDATRDVRFAVVMYGGVSLAIYINGVAQELYRMVQATAAVEQDNAGQRWTVILLGYWLHVAAVLTA
jgi:hypothetical protein